MQYIAILQYNNVTLFEYYTELSKIAIVFPSMLKVKDL